MKTLIYSHFFYPAIGGTARAAELLARQLSLNGVKVILVTQTEKSDAHPDGFPFEVIRRPSLLNLAKIVGSSDVVHMQGFNIFCFVLAKVFMKPVVWDHHSYDITSTGFGPRFMDLIECHHAFGGGLRGLLPTANLALRRILRDNVDVHVVHSMYQSGAIPVRRKALIRFGVETNVYCPGEDEGSYILFLGRLMSGKGEDILLRAVKLLVDEGLRPQVRLCGPTPVAGWPQSLISELGLTDLVEYVGPVHGSRVVEVLQKSMLVVIPTVTMEIFSLTALESMSCGKPLVVARIGGLLEFPSDCTMYFEPWNPRDLAQKLKWFLSNRGEAGKIGRRAREIAMRSFGAERMTRDYIKVYSSVLSGENLGLNKVYNEDKGGDF